MVQRSQGAGPRDLRHARHAEGRPGGAAARRGPRLLQPQPRHGARVLRRDHLARATTRTASTRWSACATPACTSAAAASSAWARSRRERAGLIAQLANLDPYPESVPINHLVQVEGTPLHAKFHGDAALDPLEFVRTIAVARITMPKAMVRLSAGRRETGRGGAGAVLRRRRQLDLLRRQAADHRQSRGRRRPRVVREAGLDAARPAFRAIAVAQRADQRAGRSARSAPRRARLELRAGRAVESAQGRARHGRPGANSSRSPATTTWASPTIPPWSPRARDAATRWGVGAGASHLDLRTLRAARGAGSGTRGLRGALCRCARADVLDRLSRQSRDPDRRSRDAATRSSPTA